jgi:phage terminase large subunit
MTKTLTVNVPPEVFNPVYLPYLDEKSRIQIYYGGSSSGKSKFLAQRDIIDLLRGGRNFLVCRQVGRTLRGSVVQELSKIINEWELTRFFNINKTDGTITCQNGYQIVFAGLDDVEKLKSLTPAKGVFTDIRVEEATETDLPSIKQLMKRQRGGSEAIPKRITLSFNPVLKTNYLYTEFLAKVGWREDQKEYHGPGFSILKTTYKDNKFLTSEDVKDLENETDPYFYNVYTLGNWGVLGHVIFTNWKVQNLFKIKDQFTNRKHGLDFGFASDPAALVVTHYDKMRKTIYVFDELYQTGLTNPDLATQLQPILSTDLITCDSAEPKSIAELGRAGINARGARKGKDSVTFGIQWLQQQQIIVDSHCINMQNELSAYHWKEDAGGNAIPVPVEKQNHLIDALRYAYEDDMIDAKVETAENPFY